MTDLEARIRATRERLEKRRRAGKKFRAVPRDFEKPECATHTLLERSSSLEERASSWAVIGERVEPKELLNEPQRHCSMLPEYAYVDPLLMLDLAVAQFLFNFQRIRSARKGYEAGERSDPLGGTTFATITEKRSATSFYRIRTLLDERGLEWLRILSAHYEYMEEAAGADARMPNQVLSAVKDPAKLQKMIEVRGLSDADYLVQQDWLFPPAATSRKDLYPALDALWERFERLHHENNGWRNSRYFIEAGMIPPERAFNIVGEKWWAEHIEFAPEELVEKGGVPAPARARPEDISVAPSCFACPGVEQDINEVCNRCCFRDRCKEEASHARALIKRKCGVEDPIGEDRKAKDRDRQRRKRARDREKGH